MIHCRFHNNKHTIKTLNHTLKKVHVSLFCTVTTEWRCCTHPSRQSLRNDRNELAVLWSRVSTRSGTEMIRSEWSLLLSTAPPPPPWPQPSEESSADGERRDKRNTEFKNVVVWIGAGDEGRLERRDGGGKGFVCKRGGGATAGGVSIQYTRSREIYEGLSHCKGWGTGSIGPDSDLQGSAQTFPDVCQQRYWSCFHVEVGGRGWGMEGWREEGRVALYSTL